MSTDAPESNAAAPAPRWQPIGPIDRRVLGVLVEKAKTTPSAYPMTLNAICAAANQKSNRHPIMELEPDGVEETLQRLRELGAIGIVEGYGRVSKYRHYLYDWLGVDKVEIAVMAELLLRGAQTEGELRGRASRMESIPDLNALRQVLQSLKAKNLVVPLTPEGRGHVISHNLYSPRELEHVKSQFSQGAVASTGESGDESQSTVSSAVRFEESSDETSQLHAEIGALQSHVAQLQSEVDSLASQLQQLATAFEQLRRDLGA
jgi:uncharacterized protein YceH (UPF0502 family)